MATDRLGNKLEHGRMVMVTLPHGDQLLMRVEAVHEGGIIGGANGMQTPGQVMLLAMLPVTFDPKQPRLEDLVVVAVPSNQEAAAAGRAQATTQ